MRVTNLADSANILDRIMTDRNLTNADLVKASTEQLTFKQVHKARSGKPLTPNVQNKIVKALRAVLGPEVGTYTVKQIFPAP